MRILGGYAIVHEKVDKVAMEEWLKGIQSEHGFRDYFKYRDMQILKTMANGLSEKEYMLNVGRRAELLYMLATSKQIMDKETKEEEKSLKRKV